MDARGPSRLATEGQTQNDDGAQSKVNLLVAYFESSRQELISRISQRDNAQLLFLGAATAIFGLAFGNVTRPAILFAISPLGLGAAIIYAQHNTLIGLLSYYCGVEVTEQAKRLLDSRRCPHSWETSATLYDPERTWVTGRPHGLWGIPRIYRDRLYASLLLIVIPGLAGTVLGVISTLNWWGVCGAVINLLIGYWTYVILRNSARERTQLRAQIAQWRARQSRLVLQSDLVISLVRV